MPFPMAMGYKYGKHFLVATNTKALGLLFFYLSRVYWPSTDVCNKLKKEWQLCRLDYFASSSVGGTCIQLSFHICNR